MKQKENNQQPAVIHFDYEGNPVSFSMGSELTVNATEMAKPWGKLPKDWLKLPSTKEFLEVLSVARNLATDLNGRKSPIIEDDNMGFSHILVQTIKGKNGGTWMHRDVAIEFARWLNPKFAIWCNDRIFELLTKKQTGLSLQSVPFETDIFTKIIEMQKQIDDLENSIKFYHDMFKGVSEKVDDFSETLHDVEISGYFGPLEKQVAHWEDVAGDRAKMIIYLEEKLKVKNSDVSDIRKEAEKKEREFKKDINALETLLNEKERTIQILMNKQS